MNYPGRETDNVRNYIRYRKPAIAGTPADAATFSGRRVSLSSMARYAAAGNGQMIDADTMIWIDIADYGGFVDVLTGDDLTEVESAYTYAVTAIDEEHGQLKVTLKSTSRSRSR